MKLPFYISEALKAYFEVASEDRRALLDIELFNTDPLTCKKEYLPLLAVEAGVDIDGFEEQRQREMIENAYSFLTKAGTVGYLKKILIGAEVKESEEFVFNLVVPALNKEQYLKYLKKAREYKNVRSVLGKVTTKVENSSSVFVGAFVRTAEIIKIYPNAKSVLGKASAKVEDEVSVFIGAFIRSAEAIKIYPKES